MSASAAERFHRWTKSTGLSQERLAERLGCSQSLISAVARGDRRPGVDLVHAIERATEGWDGGQIRTEEWVEERIDPVPASPSEPEAA